MKKRILAMLLCIVMCASLMSVAAFAEESTSSNFYKDEDGIWHIANEQGLVELSDAVANGKNFVKEVVSLDKDLDMSSISDFQPIGSKSAEKEFRGYFLGNNHAIKNLTISSTDYKEGFALFGYGKCANDDYTVTDAFIKDLTLENVNVSCPGGKYVGILVGYGYEQIENCKIVNCSVEGGYQVGGYAGFLTVGYIRNSSIENCSVLANSGKGLAAGTIAGRAGGDGSLEISGNVVKNCEIKSNNANEGISAAAGLAGQILTNGTENWKISNNNIIDTKTATGEDNKLVPIGEFYLGQKVSCGKIEEHIFDNHWENDGIQPESCVIINPADNTNNFVIMNVIHETPAARIGATDYMSLAMAVEAAVDGDTVVLLKDVDTAEQIGIINKQITLDMAGHTINFTNSQPLSSGVISVHNGADLTITGEGAVNSNNAYAAIAVTAKGDDVTKLAKLTIENGTFAGRYYAITGNGTRHNTEITINGGSFYGLCDEGNLAVYHPQKGTLTINGGEFVGYSTAIEMRAGTLNVTGGIFTATSDTFSCIANGSGTTTEGAAIAIAQHTTKKDITVNISGGTFTGVKALNESNPQENNPAPQVSIAISGGTFNGEVDITDKNDSTITGGSFSTNPSEFVPDGYKVTTANGRYVVSEKTQQDYMAEVAVSVATNVVKSLIKTAKNIISYIPSYLR